MSKIIKELCGTDKQQDNIQFSQLMKDNDNIFQSAEDLNIAMLHSHNTLTATLQSDPTMLEYNTRFQWADDECENIENLILQQKINELTTKLINKDDQIESYILQHSALKDNLKNSQQNIEKLNSQIEDQSVLIKRLENELIQQKDLHQLEIEALQQQNSNLESELTKAKTALLIRIDHVRKSNNKISQCQITSKSHLFNESLDVEDQCQQNNDFDVDK